MTDLDKQPYPAAGKFPDHPLALGYVEREALKHGHLDGTDTLADRVARLFRRMLAHYARVLDQPGIETPDAHTYATAYLAAETGRATDPEAFDVLRGIIGAVRHPALSQGMSEWRPIGGAA